MSTLALRPLRRRYFRSPHVLFRWRAGLPFPAGATFSRSSPAWYIGADGLLRQAAANVPRIEWLDRDGDGVRETPTTLLEPAATNLLLWSEALDNATWTKTGLTVSPDATTAPDGQATADRLTEDTSTGQHLIMKSVSVAAGHQAFSIYLRDDGRRYASLFPQGAASGWAIFDLQAGTVAGADGANLVRAYIDDAIQIAGGVWYRCVVVVDVAVPGTLRPHVYLTNSATVAAPNYTGGGTLGVYAWGAQLEASSVASSYVPTTASTVSRSADALTFPWPHAPQAMTGYLRFVERGAVLDPDTRALFQIGTGGTRPRLWVRQSSGQGRYGIVHELDAANAVTSLLPASPVPAVGDLVELLWRLHADGSVQIEQSINGGAPVVAARTAAIGLPAAWSGQILRLSGVPSSSTTDAPAAWRDAVVIRGSDWTWDALRAFAGVAS